MLSRPLCFTADFGVKGRGRLCVGSGKLQDGTLNLTRQKNQRMGDASSSLAIFIQPDNFKLKHSKILECIEKLCCPINAIGGKIITYLTSIPDDLNLSGN